MDSNQKKFLTGFSGLQKYGRADIIAGFWVFLTALPFCFALSWGSNFPLFAGVLTAMIGGGLMGFVGGSQLMIKSGGISLVAILWFSVANLSPYTSTGIQNTLAVIVFAGIVQIILGLLRIGNWYSFVADAVVYGIVSGVSVLVLLIQIYYLVGLVPSKTNFIGLFIDFFLLLPNANFTIALIGMICLGILFFPIWVNWNFQNTIPVVFVSLIVGMILSYYWVLEKDDFFVSPPLYLREIFIFPDFSKILTWSSIEFVLMIALVGMLDTLVNIKSLEVLDLYRRTSKPNQELVAVGLGNVLCGFLGALPMVSTMLISTTNINRGANTYWSGFFHSVFLALFGLFFFYFFREIPIATLAAILIYSTYKLNSPKLLKGIYEVGYEQFIIFCVAFLLTLSLGVFAGFVGGLLSNFVIYRILGSPWKSMFYAKTEITKKGKSKTKIDIYGAALGSNYLSIRKHFKSLSANERLILDFSHTKVVDHNFLEQIYYFAHLNNLNDGRIELQGLKFHQPLSRHPLATLRLVKKVSLSEKKLTSTLDERQMDIRAVAAINNTVFEPNLTYDGVVLQGFSFAITYEIRYRENKFLKFFRDNSLSFSDVFLSKGLRMSELSHKVSTLLITVMEMEIPDFLLTKEDLISKVWQNLGYEDIDFEEYPAFSEIYRLTGEDKEAIKRFFKPQLLTFFEENQGYTMEAKENRVLIYKPKQLLDKNEIEDCIDFAERFLEYAKEGVKLEG